MAADHPIFSGAFAEPPRPDTVAARPVPVSTPVASTRPLGRRTRVPSWLQERFQTIRDQPEDQADPRDQLRRNLLGYGVSALFHALILVLLSLLVLLLPRAEGPPTIDTSLGTPFGDESGIDPVGGFDDDLMSDVEPADLETSSLLEPIEPVADLHPDALFNQAKTAPEPSSGLGGGAEFGVARFGAGGSELIRGINVKVGDPQFTLIWDNQADIDLHILEPGGAHISWEDRHGKFGGELDVDDVDGFGPENVYWVVDRNDDGQAIKGHGPAGRYQWFVHYYGGHGGMTAPTRWKVRVKQGGTVTIHEGMLRRIGERSRTFSIDVEPGPSRPARGAVEGGFPSFDPPKER